VLLAFGISPYLATREYPGFQNGGKGASVESWVWGPIGYYRSWSISACRCIKINNLSR